jgi:hypothetical protein
MGAPGILSAKISCGKPILSEISTAPVIDVEPSFTANRRQKVPEVPINEKSFGLSIAQRLTSVKMVSS